MAIGIFDVVFRAWPVVSRYSPNGREGSFVLKRTVGLVAASVFAVAGTVLVGTEAQAAQYSCPNVYVEGSRAEADCNVSSGQVRLRADCVNAPDTYSPWVGAGSWHLWTGNCPWGIRGGIIEARN